MADSAMVWALYVPVRLPLIQPGFCCLTGARFLIDYSSKFTQPGVGGEGHGRSGQ